jgi:hypothetical protein
MWESNKVWIPTSDALAKLMDIDYVKCWDNIPKTFDPNDVPQEPHPYAFNPERQPPPDESKTLVE